MEKKVKRKIASSDFLEEQLPQSRKEQFVDILKVNSWTFLKIALIFLVSFSLVFVKVYFTYYFNASVNTSFIEGHITEAERNGLMIYILIISSAVNIILYPPIFIIIAGVLKIIRQLCYTEGVLFLYEFKTGIKENWKKFLFIGLLFALVECIDVTLFAFFGFNFLTIVAFTLSVLILFPTLIVSIYYFLTYDNKLGRGLFNSLLIHLRANWKSIIISILIVGPVLLVEFLVNIILIKLLLYLVFAAIGLPVLLLLGYELYLYIFDENINIYHFPEAIRKGLYISETEKQEIEKRITQTKGESR